MNAMNATSCEITEDQEKELLTKKEIEPAKPVEFKTTKYRWLVAFSIFGLVLNAIMTTQLFATVSEQVSTATGIDLFWVLFSMLSCNLIIIPMNFVVPSMYNAWSQRTVLYICCFIQFFGAWLRLAYIFWGSFWLLIVGQWLIFSTAPMCHNIIGLIAAQWFPEKEIATASALMIIANPFSIVVAYGIMGYLGVKGYFPKDPTPDEYS